MNDRGTYGNGHGTNGHSALAAGDGYGVYWPPVLGADPSSGKRSFGPTLISMLGGALAGYFVADFPNKGIALGMVGGYFASLMLEQTSELKSINQQLSQSR